MKEGDAWRPLEHGAVTFEKADKMRGKKRTRLKHPLSALSEDGYPSKKRRQQRTVLVRFDSPGCPMARLPHERQGSGGDHDGKRDRGRTSHGKKVLRTMGGHSRVADRIMTYPNDLSGHFLLMDSCFSGSHICA